MHPSLHINYMGFDLKQYFKEGRGCRTEGTFRNPEDFGINKGLANLPYLAKIGRQINRCPASTTSLDRVASINYVTEPVIVAGGRLQDPSDGPRRQLVRLDTVW